MGTNFFSGDGRDTKFVLFEHLNIEDLLRFRTRPRRDKTQGCIFQSRVINTSGQGLLYGLRIPVDA